MRLEFVLEETTVQGSRDGLTLCEGHALLSNLLPQAYIHSSLWFLHAPFSHSGELLLRPRPGKASPAQAPPSQVPRRCLAFFHHSTSYVVVMVYLEYMGHILLIFARCQQ